MGTLLQSHRFNEADFRGARFADHPRDLRGDNDLLCLTQPAAVRDVHAAYLAAGADIVTTNSFTATRIAQADYGLGPDVVREMNAAAARLARRGRRRRRAQPTRRARATSRAPWGRPTGPPRSRPTSRIPAARNVSWEELEEAYREAAAGLLDGGADLLLVETVFDTLNAKAAIFAVRSLADELGERRPARDLRHDRRRLGADALGPDGRGVLAQRPPRRPGLRGPQLRPRAGPAPRAPRRPRPRRRPARVGLPQRRPAERPRRLRRDARGDGRRAGRMGRARPPQRGGRLLRHDPDPRRRDRRRGRRASAAVDPLDRAGHPPLGPAAGGDPAARQRLRQRRRTDERDRLRGSSPASSPRGARTRRSPWPASRWRTAPS